MDRETVNILKDEKVMAEYDPMWLVKNGLLEIKTKSAQLISLFPNSAQEVLIQKIEEYKALDKPVRFWVLKARQEGMSTITEAIIYAFTSRRENTNSLIIADIKDHSNNLYEMFRLYHARLLLSLIHI